MLQSLLPGCRKAYDSHRTPTSQEPTGAFLVDLGTFLMDLGAFLLTRGLRRAIDSRRPALDSDPEVQQSSGCRGTIPATNITVETPPGFSPGMFSCVPTCTLLAAPCRDHGP